MLSRRKRIIYISLIVLGIYVTVELFTFFRESSNDLGGSRIPNKEYLGLFTVASKNKVVFKYSNLNRIKSPISFFEYEDLRLIIYKIKSSKFYSLKNVSIDGSKNVVVGRHVTYLLLDEPMFKLRRDISSEDGIERIILNLENATPKTLVKNDTMCFYQGTFGKLGVAYNSNESNDLLITAREKHVKAIFGFISKEGQIYFVIITPQKEDGLIQDEILKTLFAPKSNSF